MRPSGSKPAGCAAGAAHAQTLAARRRQQQPCPSGSMVCQDECVAACPAAAEAVQWSGAGSAAARAPAAGGGAPWQHARGERDHEGVVQGAHHRRLDAAIGPQAAGQAAGGARRALHPAEGASLAQSQAELAIGAQLHVSALPRRWGGVHEGPVSAPMWLGAAGGAAFVLQPTIGVCASHPRGAPCRWTPAPLPQPQPLQPCAPPPRSASASQTSCRE